MPNFEVHLFHAALEIYISSFQHMYSKLKERRNHSKKGFPGKKKIACGANPTYKSNLKCDTTSYLRAWRRCINIRFYFFNSFTSISRLKAMLT